MKKRIITTILTTIALVILLNGITLSLEQKLLAGKMIRLHVVASSDSDQDQAVKLQVRDAVLETTREILSTKPQNPRRTLAANLEEIQLAANQTLQRQGSDDRAVVTMGKELFPTRYYDGFSLPAGTYTALRVTIGPGEGYNWWCVVFPSICMSASMDEFQQAAQAAGLSDGEIKLITENSEGYVLKFKSMELLQTIKDWFS